MSNTNCSIIHILKGDTVNNFIHECTCVAIVHMGLYTSDIGWGRGLYIVHETVRRQ